MRSKCRWKILQPLMAVVWASITCTTIEVRSASGQDRVAAVRTIADPDTEFGPPVVELLEDNAETLLPLLTNPTGMPGVGEVEKDVVFSGKTSVRIRPLQRYEPRLPGWNFRIAENPGPGEYRYVRFAWKADGSIGLMLHLHDAQWWNCCYFSGANAPAWPAKPVDPQPPMNWVVVTRDLYKDYGARTITGLGMSAFEGTGYFDHVFLARTLEDIDRAEAAALRAAGPVELNARDLDVLWADLASDDAARSHRAIWKLAADPQHALAFVKQNLAADSDEAQLRRWIADLEDDDWTVRDRASQRLAEHIIAAEHLLAQVLRGDPSPELQTRVEMLLKLRERATTDGDVMQRAIRALACMGTRESWHALAELARGPRGARVTIETAAAIKQWKSTTTRPTLLESPAIEENGADFAAVAQRAWPVPAAGEGSRIQLGLHIVNRTDRMMQVNLMDTVRLVLTDSNGRMLHESRARNGPMIPDPVLLAKRGKQILWRDAALETSGNGALQLAGEDGGAAWKITGLKPGRYTLSFVYESNDDVLPSILAKPAGHATPEEAPFWRGKASTHSVLIEIAPAATTRALK